MQLLPAFITRWLDARIDARIAIAKQRDADSFVTACKSMRLSDRHSPGTEDRNEILRRQSFGFGGDNMNRRPVRSDGAGFSTRQSTGEAC